jgi:hypothetical protein
MHELIAKDVIQVTVCIQEQNRFQAQLFDLCLQLLLLFGKITARVDNAALLVFVIQNIGIFLDGIKSK